MLVIIPASLKSSYPKLKQYTLNDNNGILTQFALESTLRKKTAQSIHTKILLQMIAKRGNIIWVPSYRDEMNDKLDKTMLIGVDSNSKGDVHLMGAVGTTNSTFSLHSSFTTPYDPAGNKFK